MTGNEGTFPMAKRVPRRARVERPLDVSVVSSAYDEAIEDRVRATKGDEARAGRRYSEAAEALEQDLKLFVREARRLLKRVAKRAQQIAPGGVTPGVLSRFLLTEGEAQSSKPLPGSLAEELTPHLPPAPGIVELGNVAMVFALAEVGVASLSAASERARRQALAAIKEAPGGSPRAVEVGARRRRGRPSKAADVVRKVFEKYPRFTRQLDEWLAFDDEVHFLSGRDREREMKKLLLRAQRP